MNYQFCKHFSYNYINFPCLFSVATIPVAVTSNQPACPGEPVAVQCTLEGDVLTWIMPGGAFSILRGRQGEGNEGSFHWTLQELDENTLQSTLTFAATTGLAIGCSNWTGSSSVSVQVEGASNNYRTCRLLGSFRDRSVNLTTLFPNKQMQCVKFVIIIMFYFPNN